MKVLLLTALEEEMRRMGRWPHVQRLVTGPGASSAAASLDAAIAVHQPQLILACGFAGALDPKLRVGEVIEPEEVIDHPVQGTGLRLLSVSQVVTTVQEKARLFSLCGAAAVDLESYALLQTARRRNIALRVVRAISDDAATSIPPEALRWVDERGFDRALVAARDIMAKPSLLPAANLLGRNAKVAGQALAQRVNQMVTSL